MGGMTNKLTKLALRYVKPGATAKRLADGGDCFLKSGERLQILANGILVRWQKLLALGFFGLARD